MDNIAKNKVICSAKVAKSILKKVDDVWQVDYPKVVRHHFDKEKLSDEEIKEIKKDFHKVTDWKYWQYNWEAKTNKVIIDEKQDIAVLDFDTQYVPPKLIMCKLLIESPKDRLIWHYEFDGNIRTINNNKGNPKKIIRTQDLQEYDKLLNEYEKQSEQELEME